MVLSPSFFKVQKEPIVKSRSIMFLVNVDTRSLQIFDKVDIIKETEKDYKTSNKRLRTNKFKL